MSDLPKDAPFRDRIREFRRVPASLIADNPANWRVHPESQIAGMRAALDEIGMADALLVYDSERTGALTLIDGAMRRSMGDEIHWPCLITDLTDEEADKLLAVHDPLSGLATRDDGALNSLVSGIQADNESFARLVSSLVKQEREIDALPEDVSPPDIEREMATEERSASLALRPMERHHFLIVYCEDEGQWEAVLASVGLSGPAANPVPPGISRVLSAGDFLGRAGSQG